MQSHKQLREEQDEQLEEISNVSNTHPSYKLPLDSLATPLSRGGHRHRDQQADKDGEEDQHGNGQDAGQDELRDQEALEPAQV
jgi:hypothetical protein